MAFKMRGWSPFTKIEDLFKKAKKHVGFKKGSVGLKNLKGPDGWKANTYFKPGSWTGNLSKTFKRKGGKNLNVNLGSGWSSKKGLSWKIGLKKTF